MLEYWATQSATLDQRYACQSELQKVLYVPIHLLYDHVTLFPCVSKRILSEDRGRYGHDWFSFKLFFSHFICRMAHLSLQSVYLQDYVLCFNDAYLGGNLRLSPPSQPTLDGLLPLWGYELHHQLEACSVTADYVQHCKCFISLLSLLLPNGTRISKFLFNV